jgi:hypothetical protein
MHHPPPSPLLPQPTSVIQCRAPVRRYVTRVPTDGTNNLSIVIETMTKEDACQIDCPPAPWTVNTSQDLVFRITHAGCSDWQPLLAVRYDLAVITVLQSLAVVPMVATPTATSVVTPT